MSRSVVETALQQNQDVDYLIDIHRDSLRQEKQRLLSTANRTLK